MIDTAARMRYVYIRTYAGQRQPDEFIARAATIRGRLLFLLLRQWWVGITISSEAERAF